MEAEPRMSFVQWFFMALGTRYTIMLPLAALIAFVVIIVVLARGRGWAAGAAAVLAPLMPLLVGLLGTIDGLIMSYMVIASSDAAPKPSEVAEGVSTSLVAALVGLTLTAPIYLVAVFGLLIRSLMAEKGK
jgi:MotA/TolQ/ExbB proton channel family protein